jgi:hypothetical protein
MATYLHAASAIATLLLCVACATAPELRRLASRYDLWIHRLQFIARVAHPVNSLTR